MWQRLEKMKFNEEGEKPRKPQFLDIDPVRGAPYHKQAPPEPTDYESAIPLEDEMLLDRENRRKRDNMLINMIGRYPKTFMKYENFANYSQADKNATIQDYMNEMNRACEFHEFMAIVSEHLKEEAAMPENMLEHRSEMMS